MSMRARKLAGTILMLLWLVFYALVMMALGGRFIVGNGFFVELAFYITAGFAWIPVAMLIIRWMTRPD